MRRSVLRIVAALALALAGCSTNFQPGALPLPNPQPRALPLPNPQLPAQPDTLQACPRTRWIAILSQEVRSCPAAPGFKARPLFGLKQNAQAREPETVQGSEGAVLARRGPSDLDRFCIYEAIKPSPKLALRPPPLLKPADVVRLDPDCLGAATLGNEMENRAWGGFQTQFLEQVGFAPEAIRAPRDTVVRIAFVDSQETNLEMPTRSSCSRHGYSLAHMAQRMLCAPGRPGGTVCAARISTRLAFHVPRDPAVSREMPSCAGGLVGWIADLGPAIQEEVEAFDPRGNQRLIINLSVGWDGTHFGGLESSVCEMEAPVQAVYTALEAAEKKGILVVAAAGNGSGGPAENSGPVLPAAWEVRPAGGPCGREPAPAPTSAPLVYAVGGVRKDGTRLFNARAGATPPRVAYGDHAVVGLGVDGGDHTAILTGTSVSAAVVSAAAAIVWGQEPDLNPAGVIEKLEDRAGGVGLATAMRVDFGAESGRRPVRICLHGACPPDGDSPIDFDPGEFALAETIDARTFSRIEPAPSPCQADALLVTGRRHLPDPPCRADLLVAASDQPWVVTQPESTPCPACGVQPPSDRLVRDFALPVGLFPPLAGEMASPAPLAPTVTTLFIEIPEEWWPGTESLKATTLELTVDDGLGSVRYDFLIDRDFDREGWEGPARVKVTNLEIPRRALASRMPPQIVSAFVNFERVVDDHTMTVSSPLFVP